MRAGEAPQTHLKRGKCSKTRAHVFPADPRPFQLNSGVLCGVEKCVEWRSRCWGLNQSELTERLPRVRSIMAEPDYMDGDCDELIKPKKLINPVKTSRNHQDLHRELLMNQKRGLAPQNKPELQKVMEKRKRDQVLKAQKEEQEAHKKHSDLEIELMKRQQKLEQLELEQQKNEEEQENTPEFVKMKSNLRRTKQEVDEQERTT